MDIPECFICTHKFDGEQHRPRSLPCGHGLCSECVDACIARDNRLCPVCGVKHSANHATELPVNYLLEELLNKASTLESDLKEDGISVCSKHKGVPLHFRCKTHNMQVCHSCTVIDHPASSCTLIPLDDFIEEMKKEEIVAVKKRKQRIMDIRKNLNKMKKRTIDYVSKQKSKKQKLKEAIQLLSTKIDEIDKKIIIKRQSEDYITAAIKFCYKSNKEFELLENKLISSKGKHGIFKECKIAEIDIAINDLWEEKLRSYLNVKMVPVRIQEQEVDDGDNEEEDGKRDWVGIKHIELFQSQANVSRASSVKSLKKNNNILVNAIIELTTTGL